MPANQQLINKLAPHAHRVSEGKGDDYDFLPASLLCAIETNQETKTLVDSVDKKVDALRLGLVKTNQETKTLFDSVDKKVDSLRLGLVKNGEEIRLGFERVDGATASAHGEVVKLIRWLMLLSGITAIMVVAVIVLLARHV
jgi:hypothetical protein